MRASRCCKDRRSQSWRTPISFFSGYALLSYDIPETTVLMRVREILTQGHQFWKIYKIMELIAFGFYSAFNAIRRFYFAISTFWVLLVSDLSYFDNCNILFLYFYSDIVDPDHMPSSVHLIRIYTVVFFNAWLMVKTSSTHGRVIIVYLSECLE